MRSATSWWIIALVIFLLDLYVFQALKTVSQQGSERGRQAIFITYWVVSFFTIATMLSFPYLQFLQTSKIFRNYVFAILIGLFLAKLIGSLFFVADDIRRGALVLMNKIFPLSGAQYMGPEGQGIPRSTFLSWLGLGLGGTLFGTLLFGFSNKYNYQVKKIKLSFKNLPAAFKGMRMVHISDIHSGSFQDIRAVNKGIDLILKQQADIIVAALGKAEFLKADMVKDGATVIDVGITRLKDASKKNGFKLVGDVAFEEVSKKSEFITPVPGGVGPMTIAMLLTLAGLSRCAIQDILKNLFAHGLDGGSAIHNLAAVDVHIF